MWWLAMRLVPLATVTVFLSSAPTARTWWLRRADEGDRRRGVAPGPAQHLHRLARGPGPHHRVVAADVDGPVVGEDGVDHRAQAGEGVGVVVGDGLVGQVAAGHHQGPAEAVEQEGVERGVGQHEAQLGQAGGDAGGAGRSRPGGGRGRSGAGATPAPPRPPALRWATRRASSRSRTITANGLSSRALRRRSSATASGVAGVDGQVVAAQALDGQDSSRRQQGHRLVEGVVGLGHEVAVGREQGELGAADRAAHRLGVEAAVGGVGVLGPAVVAQDEAGHGGRRPVVGDRRDDRVPGPAVGAVDERVAEAAVGGVEHLPGAVGAGGHVDAHRHRRRPLHPAVDDGEGRRARAARRPARR